MGKVLMFWTLVLLLTLAMLCGDLCHAMIEKAKGGVSNAQRKVSSMSFSYQVEIIQSLGKHQQASPVPIFISGPDVHAGGHIGFPSEPFRNLTYLPADVNVWVDNRPWDVTDTRLFRHGSGTEHFMTLTDSEKKDQALVFNVTIRNKTAYFQIVFGSLDFKMFAVPGPKRRFHLARKTALVGESVIVEGIRVDDPWMQDMVKLEVFHNLVDVTGSKRLKTLPNGGFSLVNVTCYDSGNWFVRATHASSRTGYTQVIQLIVKCKIRLTTPSSSPGQPERTPYSTRSVYSCRAMSNPAPYLYWTVMMPNGYVNRFSTSTRLVHHDDLEREAILTLRPEQMEMFNGGILQCVGIRGRRRELVVLKTTLLEFLDRTTTPLLPATLPWRSQLHVTSQTDRVHVGNSAERGDDRRGYLTPESTPQFGSHSPPSDLETEVTPDLTSPVDNTPPSRKPSTSLIAQTSDRSTVVLTSNNRIQPTTTSRPKSTTKSHASTSDSQSSSSTTTITRTSTVASSPTIVTTVMLPADATSKLLPTFPKQNPQTTVQTHSISGTTITRTPTVSTSPPPPTTFPPGSVVEIDLATSTASLMDTAISPNMPSTAFVTEVRATNKPLETIVTTSAPIPAAATPKRPSSSKFSSRPTSTASLSQPTKTTTSPSQPTTETTFSSQPTTTTTSPSQPTTTTTSPPQPTKTTTSPSQPTTETTFSSQPTTTTTSPSQPTKTTTSPSQPTTETTFSSQPTTTTTSPSQPTTTTTSPPQPTKTTTSPSQPTTETTFSSQPTTTTTSPSQPTTTTTSPPQPTTTTTSPSQPSTVTTETTRAPTLNGKSAVPSSFLIMVLSTMSPIINAQTKPLTDIGPKHNESTPEQQSTTRNPTYKTSSTSIITTSRSSVSHQPNHNLTHTSVSPATGATTPGVRTSLNTHSGTAILSQTAPGQSRPLHSTTVSTTPAASADTTTRIKPVHVSSSSKRDGSVLRANTKDTASPTQSSVSLSGLYNSKGTESNSRSTRAVWEDIDSYDKPPTDPESESNEPNAVLEPATASHPVTSFLYHTSEVTNAWRTTLIETSHMYMTAIIDWAAVTTPGFEEDTVNSTTPRDWVQLLLLIGVSLIVFVVIVGIIVVISYKVHTRHKANASTDQSSSNRDRKSEERNCNEGDTLRNETDSDVETSSTRAPVDSNSFIFPDQREPVDMPPDPLAQNGAQVDADPYTVNLSLQNIDGASADTRTLQACASTMGHRDPATGSIASLSRLEETTRAHQRANDQCMQVQQRSAPPVFRDEPPVSLPSRAWTQGGGILQRNEHQRQRQQIHSFDQLQLGTDEQQAESQQQAQPQQQAQFTYPAGSEQNGPLGMTSSYLEHSGVPINSDLNHNGGEVIESSPVLAVPPSASLSVYLNQYTHSRVQQQPEHTTHQDQQSRPTVRVLPIQPVSSLQTHDSISGATGIQVTNGSRYSSPPHEYTSGASHEYTSGASQLPTQISSAEHRPGPQSLQSYGGQSLQYDSLHLPQVPLPLATPSPLPPPSMPLPCTQRHPSVSSQESGEPPTGSPIDEAGPLSMDN
ncbi:mucin-2-like [Sycon ciliatum]|uniref:mucin-2-like n=1 Tax=Sycon ciliatum TaxID=27933 RepID=UPI0031F60F91